MPDISRKMLNDVELVDGINKVVWFDDLAYESVSLEAQIFFLFGDMNECQLSNFSISATTRAMARNL